MFAFVAEDPGGMKGERFRNLQRSTARAYCSALGHNKRRKQRLPVKLPDLRRADSNRDLSSRDILRLRSIANRQYYKSRSIAAGSLADHDREENQDEIAEYLTLLPNAIITHQYGDHGIEGRSLQFFWERTAVEWSGWHDRLFWSELALQAMTSQASVKHALVSISAFHEAVELDADRRVSHRSFAMKEAHKALACLTTDHDKMSISAILTTYVAVAMSILSTGDLRSYKVLQLQFELIDEFRQRPNNIAHFEWIYITRYLEPVIDRLRAKAGHYVDPLVGLRKTPAAHFFVGEMIRIPEKFVSTQEAQAVLENLLNWTTFTAKSSLPTATQLPDQAEDLLESYLIALDEYMKSTMANDEREKCNATLLRISAKYGYMMIKNLFADDSDELFFDSFTPLYEEFLECFRQVLRYTKKKLRVDTDIFASTELLNVCFGIDGGVMTFAGQTALRWCRTPSIRRELIQLLYTSQLREGGEAAQAWALIAENVMNIEEQGLSDVKTCQDIPLQSRLRVNMYRFWFGHPQHGSVQHLQCLVYPWTPTDLYDTYLSHGHNCPFEQSLNDSSYDKPQMKMGRGYLSVLDLESPDKYITIQDPKFYHLIPSV